MTAELAQLCAYIVDAAKYLNQQREKEITGAVSSFASSGVALSFSTHMRNDMMVEIARRWMSDVFLISTHSEGWFTVSEDQSGTKCLHYQLAYPYLQIKPTHISK
ncbi:hypothetical protein GBAR_LOCUS5813 [Geodia barretti]|uniref:Uncharacterized protein n=1 Tax=Geodia barretti TaxID=519541 RepID=A0AA35RCM9_GEOBA|nr:hypothetical protein GBAR_LOCUS5813 [Geodia barretti]